jgi:hypothetical protein
MKIVNLQQFLQMPKGTLFQKYQPCVAEDICVLDDRCGDIDFYYSSLDGMSVNCSGSTEMFDILFKAGEEGSSFDLDLDTVGRDGCFEEKQLFLVWEKPDVEYLIKRLQESLKEQSK